MKKIEAKLSKYKDHALVLFRLVFGLLFMVHGAQKLFGLFGGNAVPLASLLGVAGVVEFFGGILIAIGLLTRLVSALSAVQMLVAYVMVHAPKGWNPVANKGELALLYFAAFVLLAVWGGGRASLDAALKK
ncbi:DoxX family protein [Candidatus Woesearchaeota archaeon]|nr:MAG: DoxX family protein [Candidatus Woesearchaeota archaeon]